jgi:hypothetical protein
MRRNLFLASGLLLTSFHPSTQAGQGDSLFERPADSREYLLVADVDDRQDRRDERGWSDERQDKRDCRRDEGYVGQDKRDCKQ